MHKDVWASSPTRAKQSRPIFLPHSVLETCAAAFLLIALLIAYVPIVVPINTSYDALWYHLAIAESYAVTGGIHPFREGWFLGAYPHLSSFLYAWAFSGPGDFHAHVLLAAHIEFALFVGTLLGISALASKLAQRRLPYAAAALFLFPGLFVYDSCLSTGADHILAFFTPVVALSLLRLGRNQNSTRDAILSGSLVAGAVCTKYQACYLVVPTISLLVFIARKRRNHTAVFVWFITAGLVTATHWFKNLVYYHDPFYPLLHSWFPSRPYHADVSRWLKEFYWPAATMPTGKGWHKFFNALLATFHFSFSPDGMFTRNNKSLPLFGSLFTLLIPALLFMRQTGRLWYQVLAIQAGIFVWYLTTHQERFLQVLAPWMAAVTAVILVRLWQQSRITRTAIVPLVGLQVIWGADLFALPRHAMNGNAPLRQAIEYFASGYDNRKNTRFRMPDSAETLRPRMYDGSRVLLHAQRMHLGLGVDVVTDETGWQGAINYLDHTTPSDTIALFRKLGITHVMWAPYPALFTESEVARELVFLRAVHQVAMPERLGNDWFVEPLTKTERNPKLGQEPTRILWLGCSYGRTAGYYTPRDWDRKQLTEPLPAHTRFREAEWPNNANAVAVEPTCASAPEALATVRSDFSRFGVISGIELWVRTTGTRR